MHNNRRKFMLTAGLVAGSAALGGVQALAAGKTSSPEREVEAVIASYGDAVKFTKQGTKAEYRVKIGSLERFAQTFDPGNLPFEQIRVGEGNTMHFNHGGVEITIVHLS